jgi:hypothetical protein
MNPYHYQFFHFEDLERVMDYLKNSNISMKPAHKKYGYVEVIASGDNILLGKYENVIFVVSDNKMETPIDYLTQMTVELTDADNTFSDFKFGKFKLDPVDSEKILLDSEFNEVLFYNLIPALLTEMIKTDILIKESNLRAKIISEEESKIIQEVSRLSNIITKSNQITELEKILSEVQAYNMDFFRKFMQFKDINEEVFSSIVKSETISTEIGGLLKERVTEQKELLENMKYFESKFEQTLNGIRDLFSLVSLRLDMLRNKENTELQARTSSLQAAAAIIEFVAVFYYTLKIWEYFRPLENTPLSVSFTLLLVFSILVVACTEVLGEYIRERTISKKLLTLTTILGIVTFLMFHVPTLF